MQIRGYLHRYRLSSSGKKNRMLQGTCMPSYSPVLKNAGYGLLLTLLFSASGKYRNVLCSAALLWQKEASDIPSKSELLKFLYFTQCALLPGQILCINPHPAKRYVR